LKQVQAFCDEIDNIYQQTIANIPKSFYLLDNIKINLIKRDITVPNNYANNCTTIKIQQFVNTMTLLLHASAYNGHLQGGGYKGKSSYG
jgi:hypothetical protein